MVEADSFNNEQTCWKEFLQGNHDAFSIIFKKNYNSLFQYARKQCGVVELAHECVQQLFYQLWIGRKNISAVANVQAYLFKALRNSLQKEKKYQQRFLLIESSPAAITFSHEEIHIDDEKNEIRKKKISDALNNLSKRQREIVYLKYYENLSYQQIAEILGINYQSVVNAVYRAIERLREVKELKHLVLMTLVMPLLFILSLHIF